MKLKSKSVFLAFLSYGFLLQSGITSAAEVTFTSYTATGSADTSWVNVSGYDSIVAGNTGGASTTFGTVTWGAMTAGDLETSANGVTINYSAPSAAWALATSGFYSGGPDLLNNGAYSGSLQASGVDYTINLSGLTVGKDYRVQFVLADNRDNTGHATILAKGANVTGDSARTRYSYTDGQFAVITASFTADAATAQFQPGQRWGDDVPTATFVSGVHVLAVSTPSLTWDNGTSNFLWSTSDANWAGSAWDNVTLNSAIFGATGAGTVTLGEPIFAKDITFNAPGYTITGDTLSLTAPIITTNAAATISSTIDGMGGLIKEGTATLTLSGTNLFTDSTTINAGTLALGNNLALQYSSFNTASVGTLDLSTVNTPTLGGLTGGGNLTLPANVTSLTLNPPSGSLNYSGSLSGGAAGIALVKSGAGSQTLSGISDHSGGTTITEGALVAGNNSALGSGTITLDGGTLSAANSPTLANAIQVEGAGVLDTPSGGNLYLNGNLTGLGTVTKTGPWSLILGGDHSGFSGTFIHSASNTYLATASSGSATAAWDITGGVLAAGISDSNTTVSFGSLSGSGTLASSGSNSTTTFSIGALGTDTTFSGNIQNAFGGTNNFVAITKTGSGTLTLAGNNSYTGNTTVSAGTLLLADNAQLTFVISDGDSNTVTGNGIATLNGDFNINTSAVTGTAGGIWTLVDRASLTGETFDDTTFTVIGFDDTDNNGVWTLTDAKGNWSFDEASGELTLDIGNDYDAWKSANGVIGGENDDDDNDGLTNHEEYAFGLDPTGSSSVNPITAQLDKSTGKFSYTRRDTTLSDPALNYTIWYSTNLSVWAEDNGAIEGTPVLAGEVETVEVTVSPALLTNPKLFIQVRAN